METVQKQDVEVRKIEYAGCTIKVKIDRNQDGDARSILTYADKGYHIFSSREDWKCPKVAIETVIEHMIRMAQWDCDSINRILEEALRKA
jgi:hypothetical protein